MLIIGCPKTDQFLEDLETLYNNKIEIELNETEQEILKSLLHIEDQQDEQSIS